MNRLAVFFLLMVLLPFSSLPLSAWQKEAQPRKKQLSVSEQAKVDEFEEAVKRFEDLIEQLDDPAKQHHMRYELVKIHYPARKKRAAEIIRTLDRQLIPEYFRNEFKYMKYKVEDEEDLYAELQFERAVERGGDAAFCYAMEFVTIEQAQPFLEEFDDPLYLSYAYHDLTLKAIERGDDDLADEFTEKWFVQIKEGANLLRHLPFSLYDEGEDERAKDLGRRVLDFAIEKDSPSYLYRAVLIAAEVGMPELVIKAHKRFEAVASDNLGFAPPPIEFSLARAYARQGNYELAIKNLEECEMFPFEIVEIIVNGLIRKGEVELAIELKEKLVEVKAKIVVLLEIASTAAEELGLQKLVDDSLAECRQLALDHADDEEISRNEIISGAYYERIAGTHFRLGKEDEGRQWVSKLTNKKYRVHGVLSEVQWLAKQIDK